LPSLKSLNLFIAVLYSVFAADTLLYSVTLTFDPVTFAFDLWPWTYAAYRLWRDETLYQTWTQSHNLRWSYCNFSDLMTLNIALRVALGSRIIFTKLDLRQLIRDNPCMNYSVFNADTLYHAVTLTLTLTSW